MIDPDFAGLAELERRIRRELYGDDTRVVGGVYGSFQSAADWDTIVRIKGIIFAYDRVLEMMREIQREMNEPVRRAV
jgi:hypothetical protein